MKSRLIIVINPRSSGFSFISKKILKPVYASSLSEGEIITFEIQPTNPLDNAQKMAKILKNGDKILVAGGDGTAHIASNAVAFSGKKIQIKYTGFGNFNDYACSFSKNTPQAAIRALEKGETVSVLRPLEIFINGEFYRYAPLYATFGLTAEATEIFDLPKIRNRLKKIKNRNLRHLISLTKAAKFYFKNRKKHILKIAKIITGNDEVFEIRDKITDVAFMNGPRMARVMRSKINKTDSENFGFTAMNSGDFRANIPFLVKGIFGHIPLKRVKNVKIEFKKPSKIALQIEGEVYRITDVKTLEVRISKEKIKVL